MRLDVSAVVSIWWNPEEVGSNANEGMNLQKQAGKERKVPCFMSFTWSAPEDVATFMLELHTF